MENKQKIRNVTLCTLIWVVARHSRTQPHTAAHSRRHSSLGTAGDYTGYFETKVDDKLFWNFVWFFISIVVSKSARKRRGYLHRGREITDSCRAPLKTALMDKWWSHLHFICIAAVHIIFILYQNCYFCGCCRLYLRLWLPLPKKMCRIQILAKYSINYCM